METKQLQTVTFEQAKKLKELGFDWETRDYYNSDDHFQKLNPLNIGGAFKNHNNPNGCSYRLKFFSAPTVALALMWFRSVHKLVSEVRIYSDCVYCFDLHKNGILLHHSLLSFKTYELAESASLDELLNLIKTKNV